MDNRDDLRRKERQYDNVLAVSGSLENMRLLLNRDFSENTLKFLSQYYKTFYPFDREKHNCFDETLEDLFLKPNFNTKTKKSDLYEYLQINLMRLSILAEYHPIKHVTDKTPSLIEKSGKTEEEFFGEGYSYDDHKYDVSFMAMTLKYAVQNKVVAKYRHLLPTRRTKSFKERYNYLEDAIRVYESFESNKEADNKYIQIHNNEGISDIVQNLHQCKEINQDEYRNVEVKYITPKGSLIELDVDTGEGINIFDIAEQVNDLIGATQSQLIVYIMSLVFEQNEGTKSSNYWKVDIDVKEYCELKGIEYRTERANEIYEDIKNLQRIIIQYEYTNSKGKKDILEKSSLFANRGILTSYGNDNVTIEKQVVGVALGKWIETLKVDQFQFINKAFFKYKLRNNKGTIIPISYYINCQHRNNLKRAKGGANEFKIKVSRLTSKLGISEDTIKNQGYKKKLKASLEKTLNDIKEAEGFNWSYKNGNHNSRLEFEEDVIIFKNTDLDSHYNSVGYEKKETKKPKNKK